MVFKGVSASNDTHFHNKEARFRGTTSPRRNREEQWARNLLCPRAAPIPSSGAVRGGCSYAEGLGGTGAGGQTPREQGTRVGPKPGWRPRGARRRRLQPRFKGQRGAEGSLPTARHGSLRYERREATARLDPQNSLFVPPPREHPARDSFLSRVSPPPPAESCKSNRGGQHSAIRCGVPSPGRGHSFSCPSTVPGRRPGGSPGAATRLRCGRRGSGAMR